MTPAATARIAANFLLLSVLVASWPGHSQAGTRGAVFYEAPQAVSGDAAEKKLIYENSYAIVVGIDNYRSLPKLTGASRDANAVAAVLEDLGFSVIKILDTDATRAKITEVLGDQIPNVVRKNDRVLIYFAGHGVSTGQEGQELGYLMPVEGDKTKVRSSGISMRELQNWFADYQSKHVMFVADACYSGLALSTRSVGLSPTMHDYLSQITDRPVRISITAGGKGQVAHEWKGHGLFTHYFLEGVQGAADMSNDGIITSDELAAYIKPKVTQTALVQFSAQQNPQIGRSGEGEFVFVRNAGEVASRLDAPQAAVVTRKILDRPTGQLTIRSDPNGATIGAGQDVLGLTPWEGKIDSGAYTILVQKEGYRNEKRDIFVQAGESTVLDLNLTRDRRDYAWPWLLVSMAAAGAGAAADVAPGTAGNDKLDGTDFVPVALYAVGGLALVFSFTF